MRPDRKKDKMVGYDTVPSPAVMIPGNVSNGIGICFPSSGMSSSGSSSSHAKQEKPSYNACPPPPNLYGSPSIPNSVAPSAEKVKGGGAGGGLSSGNSSDGEKKGRRRPGRKTRQVTDSSSFSLSTNDSSVLPGKSEELDTAGLLSQEVKKQVQGASQLPSPSPSSMPNPSFKMKPVQELTSYSQLVPKPASRSEFKYVDLAAAEQVKSNFQQELPNSSSSKSSTLMATLPLEALCTVESKGGQKSKNKETLPVGIPKSKPKESSKSLKSNAGVGSKRSGSLGVDPKQSSQKGWRMCYSSGTTSINCPGGFDVPDGPELSCSQGEFGGVISPPDRSSNGSPALSHSWPESSNMAAPAIYVTGPPDKLAVGHSSTRSSHFNEHLSLEDASNCVEIGTAFLGLLRVNQHYRSEAYVTIEGVPIDILIDGLTSQNRAMEGDVVVVQLNHTSLWPRLKGTNNKQLSSSGVDDLNSKVANSSDSEVIRTEVPDFRPEHEFVGPLEYSSATGWDTNLEDGEARVTLLSSPGASLGDLHCDDYGATEQGAPFLVTDGEPSSNSGVLSVKGPGIADEVARNESSNSDGSASELSRVKVAALVESMPGRRPTGRVVAVVGESPRRKAVIGFLEVQGNTCGGRGSSSGNDASPQKAGKKQSARSGGWVIFVPVDSRFSKMVVFGSCIPEQLSKRIRDGDPTVSNELIVAQVEGWKVDSVLPRASVKQTLGPGGTIEAQTEAILFENAIHGADFPQPALACLPEGPWKIPEDEVKRRRDFRGLRVFTIDPPTAKDLDDALSVEKLDDGKLRIGVHIADVSFFLLPDTALDKEARKRSTSVYLIQKVLPMLPPLLCDELCSLNPGVDRLAFSVVWIMDPAGNILDQWIGRTIICSCAKLSYGHAQAMIDGKISEMVDVKGQEDFSDGGGLPPLHGEHSWPEVIADVRKLHDLAKRRRARRFDGGALKLDNLKLVFSLDEDGEPYDSAMYQHQDSNFLVEEFMLLANMTVARVISSAFPERSLLRRHPEPNIRKLREFEDFCTKKGLELDTSSSGALHLSLEKVRESFQDDPVLFDILILYATKPMQLAKYFCTGDLKGEEDEWAHYALAVPLYTHFTSPIRRYPDLVVHRTVAAALEAEEIIGNDGLVSVKKNGRREGGKTLSLKCFSGPVVDKDVTVTDAVRKALVVAAGRHKVPEVLELSDMAAHCNERRMACRKVKEATDRLYLWSMLKKKQGMLSDARVLALGPKFMTLYVCKIAMERRIYYDEIEGLNAEWFEATGTLVLNLCSDKVTQRKYGQTRGKPKRTVADVALLVNPTDSFSSNSEEESYEDLIREVEDRLAGKIISEDEDATACKGGGGDVEVEPAVLPITLRCFSSVAVSIHAIGGQNQPLDVAVRLYVSSYET